MDCNARTEGRRMLGEVKFEEVRVKTFDELYAEVCSELRRTSKSIDLCEKIKVAHSDLNRVQLLLLYCPSVVREFTNCIREKYEGKCESKSRELLLLAKALAPNEFQKAIEILTQALLLSPWRRSQRDSSEEEIKDFILTKAVDQDCIKWLVNVILNSDPKCSVLPKSQDQVQANVKKGLQEKQKALPKESSIARSFPSECEKKAEAMDTLRSTEIDNNLDSIREDLLGEIYFDRSCRFSQHGDHESALLDFVRAIICSGENNKKVTFTRAAMVGASLKGMGHSEEATSVFHHALQLLRNDPHADNRTKSMETISIVKALKEIKAQKEIKAGVGQITADIKAEPGVLNQVQPLQRPAGVVEIARPQVKQHLSAEPVVPPCQEERVLFDIFGKSSNPILIAASDAIEMRYDEERGRHAVANRTIPPGTTVMVDPPYSWSLYSQVYQTHCQHCCRKVLSGIPCQHCSSVVFCKWECWERSEHYHKFECPILKGLDSSEALGEMAPLCYRTVCKTDLSVLQHYVSQVESDEEEIRGEDESDVVSLANNSERNRMYLGLDSASQLDPANFSSVFALTTNARERPAGDIIKRTLVAIYLTLCLRYTGYFSSQQKLLQQQQQQQEQQGRSESRENNKNENSPPLPPSPLDEQLKQEELSNSELYTAAFMLRLSQSLSCNAYGLNHVIPHHSMHASSRQMHTIQQFGGACYPTVSIINHSCNPNIFRFTYGNVCIVRSIREILQGEEILDSYGPLFSTEDVTSRQSVLQSQYFFKCSCEACENNWPMFKELKASQAGSLREEAIYKCPACGNRIQMTGPMKKGGKENNRKCSKCRQKFDLRKVAGALMESERKYLDEKESLISSGKLNENGERVFTHHLSILQKFLTSPHKLIIESQETLKLAWYISILSPSSKNTDAY